jgi:hypothetical protein
MRSMVEGRERSELFLKNGRLRRRPSTALRAVPLPRKTGGGFDKARHI